MQQTEPATTRRARATAWWADRAGAVLPAALVAVAVVSMVVTEAVLLSTDAEVAQDVAGQDRARLTGAGAVLYGTLLVGQAALLLGRRRWPRRCLVAVLVGDLLATAWVAMTSLGTVALVVAAYTAGYLLPRRELWRLVAVTCALSLVPYTLLLTTAETPWPTSLAIGLLRSVGVIVLSALVGVSRATRRDYVRELRARIATAEREREARAGWAVQRERARMARELHDVAAHHLSGIVVTAGAAEVLLDQDPAAARALLADIRAQGSRTLDNLRTAVGVLRDGADAENEPVPALSDLPRLVSAAAEQGLDVRLRVDGSETGPGAPAGGLLVDGLGPLAGTTAYRMVQESLSNVRRHAPGTRVRVDVDTAHDRPDRPGRWVMLTVTNTAPDQPPPPRADGSGGYGLVGMTERADLVGGHVRAEATLDGGWRVRMELPAEADPDPAPPGGTP